ncbi:MAG TPA: hypothetical protein VHJ82_08880, partial [Actinomycetota bacterium]|nr:hypothetical protein [Actinomycetota bacterium]
VINSDGSGEMAFGFSGEHKRDPEFSPDGTKIAFSSDLSHPPPIFVANADGTQVREVTEGIRLSWAPSGAQLAAESSTPGGGIFRISPDGSGKSTIVDDTGNERSPVWSPSGDAIAFWADYGGSPRLFWGEIDASRRCAWVPIPNTEGAAESFDWQALGRPGATIPSCPPSPTASAPSSASPSAASPSGQSPSPSGSPSPSPSASPTPTFVLPSPDPTPTFHSRSVQLSLRGHLTLSGVVVVFDGFEPCLAGVPVKLQRRTEFGWRTLRSVVTDDEGRYEGRVRDKRGVYRSKIRELLLANDRCERATSARRRHRH